MIAQSTIADYVAPGVDWFALSPYLVPAAGALVLMVVGALTPTWPRGLYAAFTAACAVGAGVLSLFVWDDITDGAPGTLVAGALSHDTFAHLVALTVLVATALVALVTDGTLRGTSSDGPEMYALMLVAAVGAMVMGAANDLIVLFLGLETLSLALYVMAASDRRRGQDEVPVRGRRRRRESATLRRGMGGLRGLGAAAAGHARWNDPQLHARNGRLTR